MELMKVDTQFKEETASVDGLLGSLYDNDWPIGLVHGQTMGRAPYGLISPQNLSEWISIKNKIP